MTVIIIIYAYAPTIPYNMGPIQCVKMTTSHQNLNWCLGKRIEFSDPWSWECISINSVTVTEIFTFDYVTCCDRMLHSPKMYAGILFLFLFRFSFFFLSVFKLIYSW